jgi:hypothetical protein
MGRRVGIRRQAALQLQPQIANHLLQVGNALLLLRHSAVQFFKQILIETQLDFDLGKTRLIHAGLLLRRAHEYANALTVNLLAGADRRRRAAFRLAVDGDCPRGNQLLAATAAVCNAGQLQQVAQAHMIVAQSEFTGFQ